MRCIHADACTHSLQQSYVNNIIIMFLAGVVCVYLRILYVSIVHVDCSSHNIYIYIPLYCCLLAKRNALATGIQQAILIA